MEKYKIVVVDDEEHILLVTHSVLRREYDVKTFNNPSTALEFIKTNHVDLVLSDEKMGDMMSGSQLLGEVHKHDPDICNILISGQSNKDDIIRAINLGHIFSFVEKPTEKNTLLTVIKNGLDHRELKLKLVEQNKKLDRYSKDLEALVHQRTKKIVDMENFFEVGKFSASIVHNLNNPLQNIVLSFQLMESKMEEDKILDKYKKYMTLFDEGCSSLESMIKSITKSVREQSYNENVDIDINQILVDIDQFHMFNPFYKHSVDKNYDLDNSVKIISGDPLHFKQIFENLIKNSIDAMESSDKKALTVSTSSHDAHISIKISDSGIGIDQELIEKVFETGFTTKPPGKGTGLGLSITKQMVESYKGSIRVESIKGEGTSFTIDIPTT